MLLPLRRRQLFWGTLRREPATNRFDWSFAPMPMFDDRFARQNRFGPPSGVTLTSPCTGIAHRFSGCILYTGPRHLPRASPWNSAGGVAPLQRPLLEGGSCGWFPRDWLPYGSGVAAPSPCIQDALLGPCFKTGASPGLTWGRCIGGDPFCWPCCAR